MKLKKITSLFCAGTLLFGFAAAPVGQANAYTVDVEQSGDTAPVMPDEVKARYEEGRNHLFSWEDIKAESYTNVLIMPGDTFEIPVNEKDDGTIQYTGSGNTDDSGNITNDPFLFIDLSDDDVDSTYTSDGALPKGFKITGSVDNVESRTYKRSFISSGSNISVTFCEQWKNNTNCPIYLIYKGGGSGELGDSNTYERYFLQVIFYAPYYSINYRSAIDASYGFNDKVKLEDYFWRQGDFSDLTFPDYYWITDTEYTFTIPNPTYPGKHFVKWADESGSLAGLVQTEDYTTIPVKCTVTKIGSSFGGFSEFGNTSIAPKFADGSTITFNGSGGTIKGYDKYIAEIPDYDEGQDDYGYALEDYAPVKEGDTFLGWCTKEDTYYDSFLTKDDESAIYDKFFSNNYWSRTPDIVLYAKWANKTEEDLEKNGWEITDDGTLWLLDNNGANSWVTAREADDTLAPKVKSFKLGFRDKQVTYLPDGCFYGCTNLESAEFDDTVTDFGSSVFENCTSLKTVKFGKNASVGRSAFKNCPNLETVTFAGAPSSVSQTFFYAPFDLLVKIEDGDIDGFYNALGDNVSYIYIVEDEVRYPLTVNGELITENNLTVSCGDGTATFDPATNTLTLENAELTKTLVAHSDISLQNAGVVSMLPELNVVVKGELNTIEIDPFYAQGDLNITGEDAEISVESSYSGKSYVIIRSTGKLSLDNITINALQTYGDEVYVDNCVLSGGLSPSFDSKTKELVVKNSTVKQYESDKGTYIPALYAEKVTVENSTLENVELMIPNGTAVIKDSIVSLDSSSYIIGNTDGTLSITNSTVTGTGTVKNGMTDISEDKITLTDCEITKGGWKKAGEFEILPASLVSHDIEYTVSPSIDSWYKVIGGDYTVVINREDGSDIAGTLDKLTIDGEEVGAQYYTFSNEGKYALITISMNYLHTLAEDRHSAEAALSDGTASFEIVVFFEIDYSPAVTDENWYQENGKDLTLPIYRDPADGEDFSELLKEVSVDGNTVGEKNYTASLNDSASINLTLKADYLKTLDDGSHVVTVVFADGKGEFEIIVHQTGTATDTDSNTTSDSDSDTPSDTDSDTPSDTDSDTPSDTDSDNPSDTDSDTDYDFKQDENKDWTSEQTDGLTLTIENADESALTGISLNGEPIDESNYTVEQTDGGIKITLSPEFLQTLSSGSYMLTAKLTDGTAETQITINGSSKPTGTYGDMDGDGQITANDALAILRASVGMADLADEERVIADVDNDGDITANDALAILRNSVGMGDDNLVGKPVSE